MKKHLSVLSLTARESIYRIFFLWLISGIIQSAVIMLQVKEQAKAELPSITGVFDGAYIRIIFFVTIVGTLIILSKTGMQLNSKTGYTLRRLRISERSVFIWQSVYNFIIIFITVVFEAMLCFVLAKLAAEGLPEKFITNQSVYIALYKTDFIQNLFAGRDILRIVRNIITVISLGLNCAAFSYLFRRNKKWLGAVIVTAVSFGVFAVNSESYTLSNLPSDVAIISVMVIVSFAAVAAVVLRGEQYEE